MIGNFFVSAIFAAGSAAATSSALPDVLDCVEVVHAEANESDLLPGLSSFRS
ncbi:hypothetical protein [Amphiplicatus metriothermophilus]|uniref:hypothetical protein n=1 Tax=Amphiplicatus metriothermophilus TaxID=1519374 RepID=UPI00135735C8|nr:hypothetical protein [Amphiplicatus metriothermophilus]MBB5520204.1 hypothetical protein [Amphiplicatus metriothermophilus]